MQREDNVITIYKKFASNTLKNQNVKKQIEECEKLFKLICKQSDDKTNFLLENLKTKMFSLITKLETDLISHLLNESKSDIKA